MHQGLIVGNFVQGTIGGLWNNWCLDDPKMLLMPKKFIGCVVDS
jgi:hypothetical protein